jgi:hypothetical protein
VTCLLLFIFVGFAVIRYAGFVQQGAVEGVIRFSCIYCKVPYLDLAVADRLFVLKHYVFLLADYL